MEQLLRVQSRRVGSAAVVAVAGEVDMFTAPRLHAAVSRALADPEVEVTVIDLTDVEFLDQAGLTALVEAHQAAQRRDEPLRVVVDHTRPVIRPLELTGLERVLTLFHYVSEALGDPTEPSGLNG